MPTGTDLRVFLTQLRPFSENLSANFTQVRQSLESLRQSPQSTDILILPELVGADSTRPQYERCARETAARLGCHVVAGSHHDANHGQRVNCGVVADPRGRIVSVYEKLRPYGIEAELGVIPGAQVVSRAYKFGVYVGISDWAYPSTYHQLKSSSVAGLADPRPADHSGFFRDLGRASIRGFALDLERLRELRQHRATHAFLADERLTGNLSLK